MLSDKDPEIEKKESDLFLYKFGKLYSEYMVTENDKLVATYPDLEVPKSIDDWFESYSRTFEKKIKNNRKNKIINLKTLKMQRFAVIFFCFIVGFSVLTVISEANGYHLFRLLIHDESLYSRVLFKNMNDVIEAEDYLSEIPVTWKSYYYLTELPVGYFFLNTMEGFESKYLVFSNEVDEHLVFSQESLDISAQIDTENAVVDEIEINGLKGIASVKEGVTIIVWNDNSNSFVLTGNIKLEVLLKVAESINYKN